MDVYPNLPIIVALIISWRKLVWYEGYTHAQNLFYLVMVVLHIHFYWVEREASGTSNSKFLLRLRVMDDDWWWSNFVKVTMTAAKGVKWNGTHIVNVEIAFELVIQILLSAYWIGYCYQLYFLLVLLVICISANGTTLLPLMRGDVVLYYDWLWLVVIVHMLSSYSI